MMMDTANFMILDPLNLSNNTTKNSYLTRNILQMFSAAFNNLKSLMYKLYSPALAGNSPSEAHSLQPQSPIESNNGSSQVQRETPLVSSQGKASPSKFSEGVHDGDATLGAEKRGDVIAQQVEGNEVDPVEKDGRSGSLVSPGKGVEKTSMTSDPLENKALDQPLAIQAAQSKPSSSKNPADALTEAKRYSLLDVLFAKDGIVLEPLIASLVAQHTLPSVNSASHFRDLDGEWSQRVNEDLPNKESLGEALSTGDGHFGENLIEKPSVHNPFFPQGASPIVGEAAPFGLAK